MTDTILTREQRDALLVRLRDLDAQLYPPDDAPPPRGAERARVKDAYFQVLAEYFDRLPRVVMSVCPFTGKPLKRAFDPFGLDGPWWHKELLSEIAEPAAPPTFKVLLGAVHLGARGPGEVTQEVIPGPEAPYVVPRLLGLPGMVAVVHRLRLETGDVAYPIAYFSEQAIPPKRLHQPWLRQDLWFKTESGDASWLIANDKWDFDLAAWVARGQLRWVAEEPPPPRALGADSGAACPYLDLPGERRPQVLRKGTRGLGDLPTGVPFNPYEE